jgi:proteasome lid subunit RPN8/RPN11
MISSLRAIIRASVAPQHRLACRASLWRRLLKELAHRGQGERESGAFLLGTVRGPRRNIEQFVPYDDLDPNCLDTGIIVFQGTHYGQLWALCRQTGLTVVGDIHTHPGDPWQSAADRTNPMIARSGHLAIIVPGYAQRPVAINQLGLYHYRGSHTWEDWSGVVARRRFYVGMWG